MPGPLLYGIAAITDRLRAGAPTGEARIKMEIERKWMVVGWPEGLEQTEVYKMDQGYISVRGFAGRAHGAGALL